MFVSLLKKYSQTHGVVIFYTKWVTLFWVPYGTVHTLITVKHEGLSKQMVPHFCITG